MPMPCSGGCSGVRASATTAETSAATSRSNEGPRMMPAPPTMRALTARSVSAVPRVLSCLALRSSRPRPRPTTFPSSSPEPMAQSIAFLRTPGRLNPYSGEATSTASLPARARRHASTGSGNPAASRSGSNGGISRSPSNSSKSTPSLAAARAATSRSTRFPDADCKLPQTPRIFTSPDPSPAP